MDLFKPKTYNDIINSIYEKYNITIDLNNENILNIYKLAFIINVSKTKFKRPYLKEDSFINNDNNIIFNVLTQTTDIHINQHIENWDFIYNELRDHIFKNLNKSDDKNFLNLNEILIINKKSLLYLDRKINHFANYLFLKSTVDNFFIIVNNEIYNLLKSYKYDKTFNIIIDDTLNNSIIIGSKPNNFLNNHGIFIYLYKNKYKIIYGDNQYYLNIKYKLI